MKFKIYTIVFVFLGLASTLLLGCSNEQKSVEIEDYEEILSKDNIYDLGGHIAAYLMDTTVLGYEGEWLVINDLEKRSCVYLPNDFSKILDIEIEDFSSIHLKYENNERDGIQEINIPMYFSGRKDNILEIGSSVEKVITETLASTLVLPETIWEETVSDRGNNYLIAFERVSLAYYTGSDLYGKYADYQLIVKDKEGNMISSQILMGYPMALEEVYWLENISEDDFPDLILCSSYVEGQADGFTELNFYIWNNEKLMYESKPLPWNKSVSRPFWNEELSSVIFAYVGDKATMKMFTFKDGEWQFKGELTEENGLNLPEQNMPWNDENSIWCIYNAQSEWLFPGYGEWDTVEEDLDGQQTVWKYIRKNSKD